MVRSAFAAISSRFPVRQLCSINHEKAECGKISPSFMNAAILSSYLSPPGILSGSPHEKRRFPSSTFSLAYPSLFPFVNSNLFLDQHHILHPNLLLITLCAPSLPPSPPSSISTKLINDGGWVLLHLSAFVRKIVGGFVRGPPGLCRSARPRYLAGDPV